jgi:hypothetical protein
LIDSVGAKPVLFMTWARRDEPQNQRVISQTYIQLAQENQAVLAPVGLAWQHAMRTNPKMVLHNQWDNKHPNMAGSYLTACVFYSVFYHQSPAALTPVIIEGDHSYIDLNDAEAAFLQGIAWQTVVQAGTSAATNPTPATVPATGE